MYWLILSAPNYTDTVFSQNILEDVWALTALKPKESQGLQTAHQTSTPRDMINIDPTNIPLYLDGSTAVYGQSMTTRPIGSCACPTRMLPAVIWSGCRTFSPG